MPPEGLSGCLVYKQNDKNIPYIMGNELSGTKRIYHLQEDLARRISGFQSREDVNFKVIVKVVLFSVLSA